MSQASAVSSRQSFASEYSYHESEGETPLKPCYDEADALAAVQNLSAPTPTKKQGKKATCLHGNGPECGSCAEIFAAPPSPLN